MTLGPWLELWIGALLTLMILSFLYRDNPFYRFAEHLFVGVSAGYWVVLTYFSTLKPNLVTPLFGHFTEGWDALLVVPFLLGILLFSRFFPRGDWLSRWPIAVILGVYPALRITGFGQSDLVQQVNGSILPLWGPLNPGDLINNWLLVVGLLTTLVFFFF